MTSPAFLTLGELENTSRATTYGPGASLRVHPPVAAAMHRQAPLPQEYRQMSPEGLRARIHAARETLGPSLVILGHHYQRDEIIEHADFRGDSFKLSQAAAERHDVRYIVFCGVHFMAESADILSSDNQQVILPNLTAGCSMADMANLSDVLTAWEHLTGRYGPDTVPVTYMNSAANLKAFCGERGGIVCTSSNAPAVLRWAFARGQRILFFPDEHLARNSADKIGLEQDKVTVWDPSRIDESLRAAAGASLIAWKGFCSVHERFTVDQIERARAEYADVTVIVHPECRREVVQAADCDGSTEYIIDRIAAAEPGSVFAVGTEINLVNRLAAEHSDKTVFCLDPIVCPCSTMYRIHPAYLAWVLDNLVAGTTVNRITVEPETAGHALSALNRMLQLPGDSSAMETTQPARVLQPA